MKRRLLIADTYYQLLLAIQMRNTVFQQDECVILISDHSRNSSYVAEKIKEAKIFSECHHIKTKNAFQNQNTLQKIRDVCAMVFSRASCYSNILPDFENKRFDEIVCYTFDAFIDGLYYYLYRFNSDLKVSRYEEGILSYGGGEYSFKKRYYVSTIRHMIRKSNIMDHVQYFYCFYPELYEGKLQAMSVPYISADSNTAKQIKSVFSPHISYPQKYIFFTSVYDFEGGKPIGEYELICSVRSVVGNDNLLIKTHPRDTRTIFLDNGFHVDENSSIPWEAIQLSGDFHDKVFLTVNSGSVLAGSFMSESPVKTFYMYKLCDSSNNLSFKKSSDDIQRLLNQEAMKNALRMVRIAEKLEDIL